MKTSLATATMVLILACSSVVHAQQSERPWSLDFATGWDNGISGNINGSTIGTINNQTTVVLTNQYEDVYGTGLHIRIGGGYRLNPSTEARVDVIVQSLDAELAVLGDYGASPLYAQFSDYKSTSFDVGLRRYGRIETNVRPYVEGAIGLGGLTTSTRSWSPRRRTCG